MLKKTFFILIISSMFLSCFSFCFALQEKATEIIYPSIPGISIIPTTVKTLLPDYVQYVFSLFITISGLICFGSLIYAGALYLTSAGNPLMQKNAKNQIISAFVGVIIIFTSYLVSKTINPQLVNPENIKITAPTGVIVGTSSCIGDEPGGEQRTFAMDSPDFGRNIAGDVFIAKSLSFISRPGELDVKLYNGDDYNSNGRPLLKLSSDSIIKCHNMDNFSIESAQSIKFLWQMSGVYICDSPLVLDANDGVWKCNGNEKHLQSTTGLLPTDFNNNVKGIRFKNAKVPLDIPSGIRCAEDGPQKCEDDYGGTAIGDDGKECFCIISKYGAVLHKKSDLQGEATVATSNIHNLNDELVGYQTSSITTFIQGKQGSGGVWFCEDPDFIECSGPYTNLNTTNLPYDTIIDAGLCGFSPEGISSVKIDGSYLAILCKEDNLEGECAVFTANHANLINNPLGRSCCIMGNFGCQDGANSIRVIPLKGN